MAAIRCWIDSDPENNSRKAGRKPGLFALEYLRIEDWLETMSHLRLNDCVKRSLSTLTPEKLPSIDGLRRLTKSIAMLDAIICPEWEYRYYSFNSKWGENKEMASMRNGSGDDWFILFERYGAAMKGFAHEFPVAKDSLFAARIQKVVPPIFRSFLQEPAFKMGEVTFCLWRENNDSVWHVVTSEIGGVSPENDGSAELLGIFDGVPTTYHSWAEDYYERPIPLSAVEAVYKHERLSEATIALLNPEISLSEIIPDTLEIGYPTE